MWRRSPRAQAYNAEALTIASRPPHTCRRFQHPIDAAAGYAQLADDLGWSHAVSLHFPNDVHL